MQVLLKLFQLVVNQALGFQPPFGRGSIAARQIGGYIALRLSDRFL